MSELCNKLHLHSKVWIMTNGCYVKVKRTTQNGGEIKLFVEDSQDAGQPVSLLTCKRTENCMAIYLKHESTYYGLKKDGENLKLERLSEENRFFCSGNLLFEKETVAGGEEHRLKAGDMSLCLDSGKFLKLSTADSGPLEFRTEELTNN